MTPSLQITSIHLRVAELERSIDFYARQLGFVVVGQTAGQAQLATLAAPSESDGLLVLEEDARAPAAPRDSAGLFHAALLFPARAALAGWLRFAAAHGVEFDGFSDHGVSEAIYFSDPDGNGLEFYADRAPTEWPRQPDGKIAMFTRPLAIPNLLAAAAPVSSAPLAGAHWGHLHLRVTDLQRSETFYRTTLGLALMQDTYPGARFLAVDGYHHHLGLNTWGHPRVPQPPGALGLVAATFARTGETDTRELRDPDGIAVRLAPAAVAV
jgi:catechol 2,3-dioxygenase